MPTLAELRKNPPKVRQERSLNICLAPDLMAQVQELTGKLATLDQAASPGARRRRPAEGPLKEDPKAAEYRTELAAVLEKMADHEGEMRVADNKSDGEWRTWVNEHPARGEDEPGHDRDQRVTSGVCNADDLIEDLATYCYAWDGEELQPGDYDRIYADSISNPDKMELAGAVVSMYESRLDFRQLRSHLQANLQKSNGSASPDPSGSPTPDSTDESPEPSSEATTPRGMRARSPKRG
jgi:hypothetical protein